MMITKYGLSKLLLGVGLLLASVSSSQAAVTVSISGSPTDTSATVAVNGSLMVNDAIEDINNDTLRLSNPLGVWDAFGGSAGAGGVGSFGD